MKSARISDPLPGLILLNEEVSNLCVWLQKDVVVMVFSISEHYTVVLSVYNCQIPWQYHLKN